MNIILHVASISYMLLCQTNPIMMHSKLLIICVRIIQFAHYPVCGLSMHDCFSHKCKRVNEAFDIFLHLLPTGGLVLEGSTEDMVKQYLLFGGGVVRFVPMVIAVERGDATDASALFQILVSYSQFHYILLCID
jgi:hypothetical protein